MTPPIPKSALQHHIAFVGKTGSGKTGSAKSGIIEPALTAGERVCVIDPTGAWWGLRLAGDGRSKGLPIYVFGGDHGDYPLLAGQGELMAEAIGTSNTPAILDTTKLKTTERMRFFTDFADTILRVNQGPLRLVIDEAHLFAPQAGTRGAGAMPDMLHAANNLISLGRSRGLRIVLISQRPAKVHKDSLTQVETLVAMRLIAPQDRKAVEEWIADQADSKTGRDIIASLPTLKTGEAWVWSPEADFLKRVTFPRPLTYDSSKVQGTGATRRLSPIDLDKLQAKFAQIKTDAEAKDPKILQRRVAELEAQLRKAQAVPAPAAADPAALQAAEARGAARAAEQWHNIGFAAGWEAYASFIRHQIVDMPRAVYDRASATALRTALSTPAHRAAVSRFEDQIRKPDSPAAPAPSPAPARAAAPQGPRATSSSPAVASGDGDLSGPQLQLLQSLAWWMAIGHERPTRVQAAAICGWKVTSGHLKNIAGSLRSRGLIDYPDNGRMCLTDAGARAAPAPDMGVTLEQSVRGVLSGPQLQAFDRLPKDGSALARDELAKACGWEPTSGHVKNVLGSLRSLEIVCYPQQGLVARERWLVS